MDVSTDVREDAADPVHPARRVATHPVRAVAA